MRIHATSAGDVPFTPEEEAEFEADILLRPAPISEPPVSDILELLRGKGLLTQDEIDSLNTKQEK